MAASKYDPADGSITIPRWFLVFCALLGFCLSLGAVPWARSISTDLRSTRDEIYELKIQMRDSAVLQRDIEHVRESVTRIEKRLEQLEGRGKP